jgi:hypothetical protein
MDLSKLSDSDLAALHANQLDKVSDEGLSQLHAQTQQPDASKLMPFEQMRSEMRAGHFSDDPWMNAAVLSSGQGAIAEASGQPIAKLASMLGKGVSTVGSKLLQRAVGLKKFVPGLGESLADEGVMGTKGAMQQQVERGLESRGKQIGKLTQDIPAVSTQPVAEQLGSRASKLVGPNGEVLPDNIEAYHKYVEAANQASSEDFIPGEVAAFRRKQFGQVARQAGRYRDNPAESLKAQLAGEQQAGYSQALKSAPGAPPELAEADKAYSALSQASTGLNRPETLKSIPGMIKSATVDSPLAQSVLGRGLMGTGKLANTQALQKMLKVAPATSEVLLKDQE